MNHSSQHRRDRRIAHRVARAFTMVEILVVVIIIAALATMIVPRFFGKVDVANRSVAKGNIAEIEKAIEMFGTMYGQLPERLEDLVERPAYVSEDKWDTPSLRAKNLNDPWGRPFVYKQPGEHGAYDVMSLGKDGKIGGEKENADIVNWE